jgi:hypothetical protein
MTDFDGKFYIKAATNQVLIFSYIGMNTKKLKATVSPMSVKLEGSETNLEEVIITAQGIKREKQALGYAVSEIKAADLEQRAEGDVASTSGKASG